MTDFRRRLVFHDRNKRHTTPNVSTNTNLPPRDTFKGHARALDAYDLFVNTITARDTHYRQAKKLRLEADQVATEYRLSVREALATGTSTDGLVDNSHALIVKAAAHEALAAQADPSLITLGRELGASFEEIAADLFEPAEKVMVRNSAKVLSDLESLTKSWQEWSRAWQVRRIFSEFEAYGGNLANFDPAPALPSAVSKALETIREHLGYLDTLRADEQELREWREMEARATASNERV